MRGIKRGLRRQLCMALATLMLTTSVPVESLAGVLPDGAENVDEQTIAVSDNTYATESSSLPKETTEEGLEADRISDAEEEIDAEQIIVEENSIDVERAGIDITSDDAKYAIYTYMAEEFLHPNSWINDKEKQNVIESYYKYADLDNQYIWKSLSNIWKKIESVDGKTDLTEESFYKTILLAILMDEKQLQDDIAGKDGILSYDKYIPYIKVAENADETVDICNVTMNAAEMMQLVLQFSIDVQEEGDADMLYQLGMHMAEKAGVSDEALAGTDFGKEASDTLYKLFIEKVNPYKDKKKKMKCVICSKYCRQVFKPEKNWLRNTCRHVKSDR